VTTAFQENAFQYNAFQIVWSGFGGGGPGPTGVWVGGVSELPYGHDGGVSDVAHAEDGTPIGGVSKDKTDGVSRRWWIV
jgi:hypothetical protein